MEHCFLEDVDRVPWREISSFRRHRGAQRPARSGVSVRNCTRSDSVNWVQWKRALNAHLQFRASVVSMLGFQYLIRKPSSQSSRGTGSECSLLGTDESSLVASRLM